MFDEQDDHDEYDEYEDEPSVVNPYPPINTIKFDKSTTAIREVNLSNIQYSAEADELASLPGSYKDAELYGHSLILPREEVKEVKTPEVPKPKKFTEPARMLPLTGHDRYEYKYPFAKRKYYTLTTVAAAVSLAVTGIYLSCEALSTISPEEYSASLSKQSPYNAEYLYLPRFQFGGFTGGLRGEVQRRANVADGTYGTNGDAALPGIVPILRSHDRDSKISSRSTGDPYGGFGPPQFNPLKSARSASIDGISHGSNKATLTSAPLTSYIPPTDDGPTIVLDPMFHGSMMDVSYLPYNHLREIPVFWDVPLTGGPRLQYVFGHCLNLVQCSGVGTELLERERKDSEASSGTTNNDEQASTALEGASNFDPPLKAAFIHSSTFVNVDCSTPSGIDRGISQNLATANIVDVIYSPNIMDAARLFLPPIEAYGRGVVLMRHPVERVVALYEYLRLARHDSIADVVKDMNLEEFAKSGLIENNPLTRNLSGVKNDELLKSHFQVAKEILKRKFIVGLYDHIQESIERFELFFGWNLNANSLTCQNKELERETLAHYNKYSKDLNGGAERHPGLTTSALESILSKNKIDLMLYEYSRFLFDYQGRALFGVDAASPR
eukprot:CCRYP_011514-RA/>CCRYP_011514-RA protein AED:0.37 eAED:0.37 QI:289/1/1/1/0.5/0.33/3/364/610